jgi:ferrochelatase
VVLLNLGGPDQLSAVRPFLFNLFSDRAIIGLPALARYPLAALISSTRAKMARANYALMGGASPLTPATLAQAKALQSALTAKTDAMVKVFTAMRYWKPDSDAAAKAVTAFAPDEVVLLPLYPQYSTTTTASSLNAWRKAYNGPGRVQAICCYPEQADVITAHAARIEQAFEAAGRPQGVRLLFSAHGLPMKVIEAGDPYQAQVEAMAARIAARLSGDWDWRICYQSRVGPLAWLGPSTLDAIAEAGREGLGVVIAPIAFVSEHVETLVELDHDYAARAKAWGVSPYVRVGALELEANFIEGLAKMVLERLSCGAGPSPGSAFQCSRAFAGCPRAGKGIGETAA